MEKACKCGYVSSSIYLFYEHKYRCKESFQSLSKCSFCKGKFNSFSSFKKHKLLCVKWHRPKVLAMQKIEKSRNMGKPLKSNKQHSIVCPDCMNIFSNRKSYNEHIEKEQCFSNSLKKEIKETKSASSARKSFQATKFKNCRKITSSNKNSSEIKANKISHSSKSSVKNIVRTCNVCKKEYPSANLFRHLHENPQCAQFQNSMKKKEITSKNTFLTARKSLAARKSFPVLNNKSNPVTSALLNVSAKKSFRANGNSKQIKAINHVLHHYCPVCYQDLQCMKELQEHQEELNHWGRATKSLSRSCKCPFCDKTFLHVEARNAHLCSHSDLSSDEMEMFLKSTTCNECSQIFSSETRKHQHMKIEHPFSHSLILTDSDYKKLQFFSLPIKTKQALKDSLKSCPICKDVFASVQIRNKHFQSKHMDMDAQCKFCPLKYPNIKSLEMHMEKAHYEKFQFECQICCIKLATSSHVVLHINKFHPFENAKTLISSPFSRSDKKKILRMSDKLSELSVDRRDYNFFCESCGVGFANLLGLQSHQAGKRHKNQVIQNFDLGFDSSNSIDLVCSVCCEEFKSIKDFVPHRLSHLSVQSNYLKINEINGYTCEICGDVMDNHAKVQLHLFWHLQEATNEKNKPEKLSDRIESAKPSLSSAQHVAKKTFGKSIFDNKQEVVIGGIKKSLYTCDLCNVGFTSQTHYNLHIQKFCKLKNASKNTLNKVDKVNNTLKGTVKEKQTSLMEHCPLCKCLYISSISKVHSSVCNECSTQGELSTNKDIEKLILTTDLQNAVAACISCFRPFDNPKNFSDHMLNIHKNDKSYESSSIENKFENTANKNIIYCMSCNCVVLSSDAVINHEAFCHNSSYKTFDTKNCNEGLQDAIRAEAAIAVCISCQKAFNSVIDISQHMKALHNFFHQVGNVSNKESGLVDFVRVPINAMASVETTNADELCLNISTTQCSQNPSHLVASPNELFNISSKTEDFNEKKISSINKEIDDLSSDLLTIESLRKHSSQLLKILISDIELLEEIGYGKLEIDQVIITVLIQMGLTPTENKESKSSLEHLRQNVQMLIDFCLKDQMENIACKLSTDEMVIMALKMLTKHETEPL